eukprot:5390831-Pyramimonas_sp.AAC.1
MHVTGARQTNPTGHAGAFSPCAGLCVYAPWGPTPTARTSQGPTYSFSSEASRGLGRKNVALNCGSRSR